MNEQQNPEGTLSPFDKQLLEIARSFAYPATPDTSHRVRTNFMVTGRAMLQREQVRTRRRLAWLAAAALLAIVGLGLLAVPEVQAVVRNIFRIGSVQIVIATPTPVTTVLPTPVAGVATTSQEVAPSPTPFWPLNMGGQTTLQDAQKELSFTMLLPHYPQDLGTPDRVFVQSFGEKSVLMAWLDKAQPTKVKLILDEIPSGAFAQKTILNSTVLSTTTVHNSRAYWVSGTHILDMYDPGETRPGQSRLVVGNVLVWVEGYITCRLETDLSMEEAVRLAASVRPVPSGH